ncbi:MAG: Immunoglobulin I-set domain protein [Verrucomicrobia bacterium]|nr:Immunoglobulin I-set domain protein [Verrucomicrobiota bacterium]
MKPLLAFLGIFLALLVPARAQLTAAVDPAFKISPALTATPTKIAVDAVGRVICVGGDFIQFVNGHAQRSIARFNSDGALDPTFDCGSGFDAGGTFVNVHVQSDGRIVITGIFTSFNGQAWRGVVRLLPNGSVDSTYIASVDSVSLSAMDLADRLYVVVGSGALLRLKTDGSNDVAFQPTAITGVVRSMAVDTTDRLILVRGIQTMVQNAYPAYGYTYSDDESIFRLNSDGSVQLSNIFFSGGGQSYNRRLLESARIVATSDGSFYVTSTISTSSYATYNPVQKYNFDATIDPSFAANYYATIYANKRSGATYAFDKLAVGVNYVTPLPNPIRVLSNGAADITFTVTLGTYTDACVLPDGRLMVASNKDVLKYVYQNYIPFAPVITVMPPTPFYAVLGSPVTLTVSALGTAPLQYSWYRGGTLVSSSSSLTLSNPVTSDAGSYTIVVSNSVGSVTSPTFTMLVEPQSPTIVTSPMSQFSDVGSSVTLSVGATGLAPLSAQWFKDGIPLNVSATIKGVASGTLQLTNVQPASAGSYLCVVTNSKGIATSMPATLIIAPAAILANLSIRTTLASGQKLIPGFVTSSAKSLLLRAVGPMLNQYGLEGLGDPTLQVYNSASVMTVQNDNWDSALASTFTQLGAFPFSTASKDSALVALVAGSNSAFAQGTGTGTVLFELYDSAPADLGRRLVNVSARNQVGIGADALIAGFVITGSGSKQVLIRGVGPKLTSFGVAGVLSDPYLQLYDATGALIGSNDNWDANLSATFAQVGAFALDSGSKDAALVITLPVGVYSAKLTGVNNGSGEGLIEVYEVWP